MDEIHKVDKAVAVAVLVLLLVLVREQDAMVCLALHHLMALYAAAVVVVDEAVLVDLEGVVQTVLVQQDWAVVVEHRMDKTLTGMQVDRAV
jgi:hypothetical protein